jgi:hypothetical protein
LIKISSVFFLSWVCPSTSPGLLDACSSFDNEQFNSHLSFLYPQASTSPKECISFEWLSLCSSFLYLKLYFPRRNVSCFSFDIKQSPFSYNLHNTE